MAREAKTSAIKRNSFKLFRVYSNSLEMTNVSEFPWTRILFLGTKPKTTYKISLQIQPSLIAPRLYRRVKIGKIAKFEEIC